MTRGQKRRAGNVGSGFEAAGALAEDMGDLLGAVTEQEADAVAGLVERLADETAALAEQGVPWEVLEDLAVHHRKVVAGARRRQGERLEAAHDCVRATRQGLRRLSRGVLAIRSPKRRAECGQSGWLLPVLVRPMP